jgi:Putative metallopeptidase
MVRALILMACLAGPVRAEEPALLHRDPAVAGFVAANIAAMVYHEVGHALIDVLALPVAGNEEDAADALSALLIDRLRPDAEADAIVRQTALAYRLYAAESERAAGNPPFWGRHSLDSQRYDNLVCLFYGADPGLRGPLADELGLPEARRATCPDEFARAAEGWGAMLKGVPPQDSAPSFRLVVPPDRDPLTALVAAEIEALNGEYGLPARIDVTVEPCGEANAFYDPRARRIVICTEYAADLARLYATRPN